MISDKTKVTKIDTHIYIVPTYEVVEGKGIQLTETGRIVIPIVRGSKVDEENKIPKQDGVLVEQLLEVCRQYLMSVNVGELRDRDSSIAITHIEDALLRLYNRQQRRIKNKTAGTYKS